MGLKIGFCVCTYNRKDLLEVCLSTLIKTTAKIANPYYLVIDDNSNDGTQEFLKKFQDQDQSVELILKNKNLGVIDSFNHSARKAVKDGCNVVFVINDDISFKKEGWAKLYLKAILESGIKHFNFMDGRNIVGRRKFNGVTVTYHNWVRGCLEVFTSEVFKLLEGYDYLFNSLGCFDTDFADRAINTGFTDENLENLLKNRLNSYGNRNMGFCADVDGVREYILDPHPNMGIYNERSFFTFKQASYNILKKKRLKEGLYRIEKDKNKLIVLAYHHISKDKSFVNKDAFSTSKKVFKEQIRTFKSLGYNFIKASDLSNYESNKLPIKPVLITFDDGYKDNLENAMPVLISERIKAILFVATKYIGSSTIKGYDLFVHILKSRKFSDVLSQYKKFVIKQNRNVNSGFLDIDDNTALRFHFRSAFTLEEQDKIADDLVKMMDFVVEPDLAKRLYLSWENIQKMKSCFEFGAHSVNHTLLSQLDDKDLIFEIGESKKILEKNVGRILWFSYPYGYPSSYSNKLIEVLKDNNYWGAFNMIPMRNSLPIYNKFEIYRYGVGNESPDQLVEYLDLNIG